MGVTLLESEIMFNDLNYKFKELCPEFIFIFKQIFSHPKKPQ